MMEEESVLPAGGGPTNGGALRGRQPWDFGAR